eukprot:TRINITY_DN103_c0_g1_i1.p1 TRINITY_DN103_c0_g1~~TRINITY_DN103_c0_g1_i1.p1  ORF type:complete len:179 (-),score=38.47 TRINITY_DN103_c0_g1_i1:51-587(-)
MALSKSCLLQLLPPHNSDVCGMRLARHPMLHYKGNMWIARCDYVRRLPSVNTPRSLVGPSPPRKGVHAPEFCTGTGRNRFEHWIGYLQDAHFSDCLGYIVENEQRYHTVYLRKGVEQWRQYGWRCGPAPKTELVRAFEEGRLVPDVHGDTTAYFVACSHAVEAYDAAHYGFRDPPAVR